MQIVSVNVGMPRELPTPEGVEGEVAAGDAVERLRTAPDRMPVRDVIHLYFF
jgi:hypothetical protein